MHALSDESMYALSSDAYALLIESKKLLLMHLLRYKLLADASERPLAECVYARMTKRHIFENIDDEIASIDNLVKLSTELRSQLSLVKEALNERTDDCSSE